MLSPAPTHTDIFMLLSQAGLMAQCILTLLCFLSIGCWGIFISKWKLFQKAENENQKFLKIFWNGKNLDEIVSKSRHLSNSPLAKLLYAIIEELRQLSPQKELILSPDKEENIERTILKSSAQEFFILEKNLHFLATTASSAPFIGLFGTVWGIMNAFQNIGATGAANLAVVAPGISEALITTAAGIGAAIPATIGYNYFIGRTKKMATEVECFSHDFINILKRNTIHLWKEKNN